MYLPAHFREDRLTVQHALIRTHSLGLLVTAGPGGLQANPVPFLVDSEASERGTLRAHIARANPQGQELAAVDECLVVFQGAQIYISPSLYPTKQEHGKVVPTWNYITVHAWGRPRLIDDANWLRRFQKGSLGRQVGGISHRASSRDCAGSEHQCKSAQKSLRRPKVTDSSSPIAWNFPVPAVQNARFNLILLQKRHSRALARLT